MSVRVVSLAPSCTEILFALGCGDQLIARTAFCDYPYEATHVPAAGGWTTANVEAVAARRPDLVLASTFLQDGIVHALRERSILVCHTDPRTLADVLQSFDSIADALGVPGRGAALHARVEADLRSADLSPDHSARRVYAEEWPEPPMASGNWVPDLICLAGGISLLPAGEPSRTVTIEEVAAFDPDIVLLNYCGMAAVPADQQVRRVTSRPEWKTLRAVRAGRIVVLDDSLLNRPGPRLVEGARAVARSLAAVPTYSLLPSVR